MDPAFIVLGIAAVALVLFVTEAIRPDLVALLVLVALAVTGIVTTKEALEGFSSSATLTVLAMFVMSAGVYRTGAVNVIANRLHRLGAGKERHVIIAVTLIMGPVSAFVNNTAAVAIMLPLVVALAVEGKRSPSRYLIPLSYASQLGGVITLIGTSTNIVASEMSVKAGHRALGLFEFAPMGIVVFAIGVLYLWFIAPRLLPHRGEGRAEHQPHFRAFVHVKNGSTAVGISANSRDATIRLGGIVVGILREGHLVAPLEGATIKQDDIVLVEGTAKSLLEAESEGLFGSVLNPREPPARMGPDESLIEVIVAPGAPFVLPEEAASSFALAGARPIGIHRKERLLPHLIGSNLVPGDTLLMVTRKDRIDDLRERPGLIVVSEVPLVEFRRKRIPHALIIFASAVTLAATGIFPIVISALAGAGAMVLTGVLTMREFYRAVRWDVIFLIAGLFPLGDAVVKTGLADSLAALFTTVGGGHAPWLLLGLIYLAAMVLTELISNTATAILMVPIAVALAISSGLDPTPFVLAVAFAASTSFMTPVGYQTNTMVYGPGGYRFTDFFRVGAPLNAILAVVTTAGLSFIYGLF